MATIYIDSSEAKKDTLDEEGQVVRKGTLLPNADSYTSITNLERFTGADILVSPWPNLPIHLKVGFKPHRSILARHCWHGCLIQRKSGTDLLNSISKLDEIICRMNAWCQNSWLVYTCIRPGKNGMATVVGSRRKSRRYWKSVQGALCAWMDRGGSVWGLVRDEDIPDWLESRARAVDKWQVEPEKMVAKSPQQPISLKNPNWANTLMLFPPGVGVKRVEKLAIHVATVREEPPTGWIVYQFACSEESLAVPGWGEKSRVATKEWLHCDGTILKDGEWYEPGDVAIADIVTGKVKGKQ